MDFSVIGGHLTEEDCEREVFQHIETLQELIQAWIPESKRKQDCLKHLEALETSAKVMFDQLEIPF